MARSLHPVNTPALCRCINQPFRWPPAVAKLTYRGGPLIPNVEVFTIFWGNLWQSSSTNVISKLNTFFGDIVVSPLIDQLAEYNVPGCP